MKHSTCAGQGMNMDRNKIIRLASITAVAGNFILATAKVTVGFMSESLSVVGDGLDSYSDVFISLITLVISFIISRPPDREHPYGHFRAETIATSILAFIMFFIGGQLALSTLEKLINHDYNTVPGTAAVYVTLLSIAGKLILSLTQYRAGKKSGSSMITANAKNMLNDIITSAGVLAGLACVYFYNAPIIDRIFAVIIGMWIMISAIRIFMGTVNEIMEGETDMNIYSVVFEEVKKIDGLSNPHRVRIRKLGVYYLLDMDVEVEDDITVTAAHDKIKILEMNIRSSVPFIYDIIIHIEPFGNIEAHERWGLTENDLSC